MSGFSEACEQVLEQIEAELAVGSEEATVMRVSDPLRLQEARGRCPMRRAVRGL